MVCAGIIACVAADNCAPTRRGFRKCCRATVYAALAVALALSVGPGARAAPPVRDPDWPCQQIKVGDLSLGSVWDGPAVDPAANDWAMDTEVADLVRRLAQRRMPVEQAKAEIAVFADRAGAQKQEKLLALVAGLYDTLDQERGSVIAGLDRFGRAQKSMAETVRADVDRLRTMQAADPRDEAGVTALSQRVEWETRIFEQRREALSTACGVPAVIEQRLYALARAVQDALH